MRVTASREYLRTEGLDSQLASCLRPLNDTPELPLTHSDVRLIGDVSEIAGGADAADQALMLALLVAREEGSLCLRVEAASLARRLEKVLREGQAVAWAERVIDRVSAVPPDSHLYGSPDEQSRPLIRLSHEGREYVYFQRYYLAASQLRESVQERLKDRAQQATADWPSVLRAVVRGAPQRLPTGKPLVPSPDQVVALVLALARPFVVISGGPGTGKTSTLCALLRCLVRADVRADEIALAAPSGRAAQRMTEALHAGIRSIKDTSEADESLLAVVGSTIHRLLGYNPATGRFWHGPDDPIEARVIVIDEVSMVDAELMHHLVDAAPPGAKLLLLGDKDQLPSVESGAVLSDLIPDGSASRLSDQLSRLIAECCTALEVEMPGIPRNPGAAAADTVVILTTNHRSGGGIQRVAERIVAGDAPNDIVDSLCTAPQDGATLRAWLEAAEADGCILIPDGTIGAAECAEHWVRGYLPPTGSYGQIVQLAARLPFNPLVDEAHALHCAETLLADVERGRILTLLRRGPYGAEGINRHLVALQGGQWGRAYPGMPILITSNDTPLGLWNGEVGVIVRDCRGQSLALFRKPDGIRTYRERDLPPWSPAYAMTVHKAQGSEYQRVLLIVPPEGGSRLLSREMVYTALTRAKQLVAIHSKTGPLIEALSRRIERDTGIGLL